MQYSRSNLTRFLSVAVAFAVLFVTVLASTESVSAASKLKVTASKKTIYVGQTLKLKANKNVKWSVSKKKVVKLTKIKKRTVTVKGLKAGTVYVKAKCGKKLKKIKITVRSRVPKKINLETTADILGVGETCTVSIKSVTPSYASTDVEFSSSDDSVAMVNEVGFVSALKTGTATITATSTKSKKIKDSVTIRVVAAKAGVLSVAIDMTDAEKYPAGKTAKAWFQIPASDENQRIANVDPKAESATVAEIVTDSSGAKAFYIEWGPDVPPEKRTAALSFFVYRRAVFHDEKLRSAEKDVAIPDDVKEWLQPTTYSGSLTSGIVKETADKIISDAKAETVYDKAHAIYLWICDNISRNKKMQDRELGDVVRILSSEEKIAGSCIDINSIFVALCNAESIPARESFGYKIYEGSSDEEQTMLGQNCRAEFYLPGYGWVEVDPAMPLGIVMNGRVSKEDTAAWESVKETYWISGSADWICQNHGRDLRFEKPAEMNAAPGYMVNADGTLNHFMFPHGEYDGQYIPGWGDYAFEFKYVYTFKEESPLACGC